MAFVTCPSVTIFELDEEWRTSSIISDRGKPSVLMKKKPKDDDSSKDSGHEKASPSLRTESRFGADEDCGEGDVDYEVEEADFGRAGHAGTPQAYQKEVDTLKRSIDLLTKNKVASLSKEDIQGMIAIGQQSAVKDVDGKLEIMKNSTMETLKKINCAYGDLVKLESDRVRIFREAVTNLKEAILDTKITESQKEEMFKKVENMKKGLDAAQKAEVARMMGEVMESTHQNALQSAAGKVEQMAQVLENNAFSCPLSLLLSSSFGFFFINTEGLPRSLTIDEVRHSSSSSKIVTLGQVTNAILYSSPFEKVPFLSWISKSVILTGAKSFGRPSPSRSSTGTDWTAV